MNKNNKTQQQNITIIISILIMIIIIIIMIIIMIVTVINNKHYRYEPIFDLRPARRPLRARGLSALRQAPATRESHGFTTAPASVVSWPFSRRADPEIKLEFASHVLYVLCCDTNTFLPTSIQKWCQMRPREVCIAAPRGNKSARSHGCLRVRRRGR